jgi:hypothetical protein
VLREAAATSSLVQREQPCAGLTFSIEPAVDTIREGDGELYRLFFRWRSSEAKLTRRQRIRLLTRLNRVTEANRIEAFSELGSPAHAELIGILHELITAKAGRQRR